MSSWRPSAVRCASLALVGLLSGIAVAACMPAGATRAQTAGGDIRSDRAPLSALGFTPSPWSDSVLATLSLRDKAAQMVWPWMIGDYQAYNSPGWQRLATLIGQEHVGGIIMSVGSPLEIASKINGLQYLSPTPLLVSADLEAGAGFRVRGGYFVPNAIDLGGATLFPQNMAFGAARDEQLAYELGRITALEARAVGVHIAFAPVMDVNNNPANPVIGVRSFSEDPQLVARLGAAAIRGMQEHGIIATAKHFPGHGDTEVNSHLGLPVVPVSRERLDRVELPPFSAAIRAGAGMVMTAHMALPAVTGDSTPATLAPAVMRDLLRRDLGFRGILSTDAMDMRGVLATMGLTEATKRAVEAGNDVILMPPDIPTAIDAIVAGVRDGRYTEARIDSSARRLLELKERLGLHQNRYVDLDKVRSVVGDAGHLAVAQRAAERGITLVKDVSRVIPLQLSPRRATPAEGSSRTDLLAVTVARRTDLGAGRDFNAELRTRYPGMREVFVDADDPEFDYDRVLRMSDLAEVTVVGSYSLAGFDVQRTNSAPRAFVEFVRELRRRPTRTIVVAFGNPYLLREIPDVPTYMIAWSGFPVSQRAAARAILGTTSISGRLPIAIPPVAAMGAGIQRTARAAPPTAGARP
ncbi:MAG: glycoside hydrolase family 3 protein [Gemmatimonadota bacterium]|nr:glycoside hydrolase family 3 protein [Gemmatimonadota bacterium]